MSRPILLLAAASLGLVIGSPASAASLVAKDGKFQADVSARQMSMISIVGEKVVTIRKMDDHKGPAILLEADGSTGQVFVGFDGDVVGRSFSAFLITESGRTIEAVLTPRDIEAETVKVILPAGEGGGPAGDEGASGAAPPPVASDQPRHEGYPEILTALIRLMFNDEAPAGVSRRVLSDPPKKAGAFEVRALETYRVAGLKGTVLDLRNVTTSGQPVNSKTFLVPGVLAAAVSHENIVPGQSGRVYLVEEDR